MTIYYSSNPRGFYDRRVLGDNIPEGAKEITEDQLQELQDGQSQGKLIREDANGYPVLIDPPVIVLSCNALCAQVDDAADRAREAVAGDPLRAVEYQRAANEARAFKDADYPADAVPPMVAAWAIGDRTAQQAADNILAEEAAYNEALLWLRTTRLAAKEEIRALMGDDQYEAAQALSDATVIAIRSTVSGVGNNDAAGGEQ